MTDRVMVDWLVPTREWERFREYVQDEHGSTRGHLGEEAETAMIEFAGLDEYAGVEEKVHELVEAAGRTPSKEKNLAGGDDIASDDTTRVTAKVKPEVKAGFREEQRTTENKPGVDFARAIRQRRQQPRGKQIEEELDRVLDDAKRLLSEVGDSEADDDETSESMPLAERKTLAIIDDLRERNNINEYTDKDLNDAIQRAAGVSSEPSIEKYRGRVADRLGMERHPGAPHLWIPHEDADKITDGEPRVIRQPTERLDRDERVRRIRLAVGRAAASRDSGDVRVESTTIQETVLDGDVSRQTTLSLMRAATLAAGIEVDDDVSPKALDVDMGMVVQVDQELAADIIEYRDETESGLLDGPTASTITDHMQSPGESPPAAESPAFSDGGTKSRSLDWLGSPGYGDTDGDDDD